MVKLLLVLTGLLHLATSIPTISVKGAKFFDSNGAQFFLKGVAYQGTPEDPLVDTAQCLLDAESMSAIGTNSIRVYHVDPWSNHDGCMKAFSDKGIYIWLDLDTFNTTITQATPEWTVTQFAAFAMVMDVFQGYDNLGGYWIGNEIITSLTGSPSAPFIKAAVADMKSYLSLKKYRKIPIGYSAADIAELRPQLQNYLACSDFDTSVDFFGLNSYEWCGEATFKNSGYINLQNMAVGYPVPMFFSETGCNVSPPRLFEDQAAIFGPDMSDTWSGSIVYEWVQEANNYGLVNYPNGEIYSGAPEPIQPDFDNLKSQWNVVAPSSISQAAYRPSLSAPACPAKSGGWQLDGDVPLPTLGAEVISSAAAGAVFTAAPATKTSSKAVNTKSTSSPSPTGTPTSTTTSGSGSASGTATRAASSATTSDGAAIGVNAPGALAVLVGAGVLLFV